MSKRSSHLQDICFFPSSESPEFKQVAEAQADSN